MSAGYTNLYIEVGATFTTTMVLTDSTGLPLDLTGFTGVCKIRRSYYSDFDVYSLTVTVSTPETTGQIIISATATETALMKPNRYVYDVELIQASTVTRVVEGIAEVRPNATR